MHLHTVYMQIVEVPFKPLHQLLLDGVNSQHTHNVSVLEDFSY